MMPGRATTSVSPEIGCSPGVRSVAREDGHRASSGGASVEVKVCGLVRPEDARAALEAGADYLGLVFADSHRRVKPSEARSMVDALPGEWWVGVFAGWTADRILAVAREARLGTVQLHGDEETATADALRAAGLAVWQAVGVSEPPDWSVVRGRLAELDGRVDLVLLDRRMAGRMGGGGAPFAWRSAPGSLSEVLSRSRLGLSGGLSAENVGDALASLPAALVDASSALESSPGVKDPERVRRFVIASRAARGAGPDRGGAE
jgi:phosphoribosylanthranilate isomerase